MTEVIEVVFFMLNKDEVTSPDWKEKWEEIKSFSKEKLGACAIHCKKVHNIYRIDIFEIRTEDEDRQHESLNYLFKRIFDFRDYLKQKI